MLSRAKHFSIKQIATQAAVSKATVDRVLHQRGSVHYQTRRRIEQALDELEGCRPLRDLMGARFVRAYVSVKRKEYETFFRVNSSWEREFLLLNV